MASYPEFDRRHVEAALEAARGYHDVEALKAKGGELTPMDDGHLSISAGCISVTVNNGQVCLNLPLGIGSVCLPIPSTFPSGTAAQACISICTTWGIPTGVRLTISIGGIVIINKTFLKC
ncbi:hypothetical protein EJC49_02535 [Aquibium carbonis]|uniref:Uncharacterized protein n=1 Tax=Aquibium carbonis TaxID=2495581 RepID=A0A429Z2V4_9HYPH|nr:hypothetical protein [Aquibium carbonis]RST88033.1 hypothetical protein EJC49_02535 [Aquibium carbonis]